jgi:hypothetical protein
MNKGHNLMFQYITVVFVKTLCGISANHTYLTGLHFKTFEHHCFRQRPRYLLFCVNLELTYALLTKCLSLWNLQVLRFPRQRSLWLCSPGTRCHVTGHVPLKCQELFTPWCDVMAQKHRVLRVKHILSKVVEKNSKYTFPKVTLPR